ncbi:hypothetical protein CLU79DRAFT_762054 [Phycomyces nitens]|nr:hypothetical protein CLU79DRAFT_762054 [Phycomyces nitens]
MKGKKFDFSGINSPLPTNLAGECKKAAKILNQFIDPGQGIDKVIPSDILAKAQGLAIYTVIKAGFLFSGRAGFGVVVARLPDDSWSAPSAIGTGGIGAGGQIGAELTDFILVLNTKEAVKTFSHFGNVTLGGNVSVAAGPIGRNAEASGTATFKHVSAIYSYSKTKGLFAGVSVEGSVILTRNDTNEKFYGKKVTAKELLNGSVPPPPAADALYRALNAKFHTLGNTGAMYSRGSEDSGQTVFRSNTISAPGTLRAPPLSGQSYGQPPQPPSSYGQPSSFSTPPPPTNYGTGSSYSTPQPPPPPSMYSKPVLPSPFAKPPPAEPAYTMPPPAYGQVPPAGPTPPSSLPTSPTPNIQRFAPPPPVRHKEPSARALYAFAGEQDGDLSFQEGDIITIISKSENQDDWWTGRIGSRQGMFPANYVQIV